MWEETLQGDGGGVCFHPTRPTYLIAQYLRATWLGRPTAGYVDPLHRVHGGRYEGNPADREHAASSFYSSPAAIQLSAAPQALPARAGLAGAHLLESQPMPAVQTAEQQIRGADASTDWVLLVSGDDASAVDAAVGGGAALYRPAHTLSAQGS